MEHHTRMPVPNISDLKSRLSGTKLDRWLSPALIALLLLVLHYFFIARFLDQFMHYDDSSWHVFMANFHMAGFDPLTYHVVTDWHMGYDILRHPLLAWLVWPLYAINSLLWQLTGANCVQFVCGALLFGCGYGSALLMRSILIRAVGTGRWTATLLTVFFLSFAYIMVSLIVPDHFCLSLFLLLLVIHQHATRSTVSTATQCLLYTLTAGVTLTNGVVVFLADIIFHGRDALRPQRVLAAYVLPTIFLLSSVLIFQQQTDSTTKWIKDNITKTEIVVENMLGESIQFHRKHILGDVLWRRPVIVRYLWWGSYAIEATYAVILVLGMWYGRRERLLWLLAATLAFNATLHILLGFAIDEVQIMTAHWAFVIPIATGYAVRRHKWLVLSILVITLYLLASNFYLLHRYLTWPLAK